MKKTIPLLFFILIIFTSFSAVPAFAYEPTAFEIHATAAILVNTDTGTILYEKNADERAEPASLTKIMTAVLVLERAKDLDEIVEVNGYCIDLLAGTDSSVAGLLEGEKISIRDLLYCLMVSSANDAANVLADHFGEGKGEQRIDQFIQQMNKRAAELSMNDTNFESAHGLSSKNHYTTVNDLVILVKHAMDLPLFMEIVQTVQYDLPATNLHEAKTLVSSNMMMDVNTSYYYQYVKGIKTGFTNAAGRCLVSTASKDGFNYLAVVLGCTPQDDAGNTIHLEYEDTENLYEWAFDNFEYKTLVETNEPLSEIKVNLSSDQDYVQLYPDQSFSSLIPAQADTSSVITNIHLYSEEIDAPVSKGAVMGTADIVYAGEIIGQVNLITGSDVKRSTLLYILKLLKEMISTTWFKLIVLVVGLLIFILILLTIIQNRRRRRYQNRKRSYRRI